MCEELRQRKVAQDQTIEKIKGRLLVSMLHAFMCFSFLLFSVSTVLLCPLGGRRKLHNWAGSLGPSFSPQSRSRTQWRGQHWLAILPYSVKICMLYLSVCYPSQCQISTGDENPNILDLLALNPALDPALNPSLTPTVVTPAVKPTKKKKSELESRVSWNLHTVVFTSAYNGGLLLPSYFYCWFLIKFCNYFWLQCCCKKVVC